MKDEDIINVLKQDYQQTVILYPIKDKIYFVGQNQGSCLDSHGDLRYNDITAKCIINQGNLRYCSWDQNNDEDKNSDEEIEYSNGEEVAALEGDILIDNFMHEIHRIYKEAEKGMNSNDILILQAFSLAVAQGKNFTGTYEQYWSLNKRDTHYIFITPNEWEHNIKEKIILPIFKNAGFVDEEDHPCKLLFLTERDALLQSLGGEMEFEKGREYILWKLEPVNGNTLSMTCDSFEASGSKFKINKKEESRQHRGTTIWNPVGVYSSNKVYSLTYIDAIRESVWTFLKDKDIIAVFHPPADLKEKVMVVIDILIGAAFVCYSKKLENKEDLTKLSEVYPFEDLDLSLYNSILNSEELIQSIDMVEMHEIMFRDNEVVIEEVLKDIVTTNHSSRSTNNRRTIVFTFDIWKDSIHEKIKLPTKITENSTSRWVNALGVDVKKVIKTGETQIEIRLSDIYIHWIYCFILKFENDAVYQSVLDPANLPHFYLHIANFYMIHFTALNFRSRTASLITRLPPLLLSLPCSHKKYVGLQDLQFTKRSNPDYIVKIDVKFYEPSTFSCAQIDSHGKNSSVNAILTTENCEAKNCMSLPALSNYFKPNSTNGLYYPERIYITTRLLEIIHTHFKYALDHFSKYDRQRSENEKLFTLEDKTLDSKDESTLNEDEGCLLFSRSFDDMIPEIKLELEKSDGKEEISQQCYIRVFFMIYLGVLKYNVSALLEEKIGKRYDAADENTIIGYTILVNAFFFHTNLKESHSSLIELAIASGLAKGEKDFKSNVRVITDKEEQLLPVLEQKLGTNLPLKSFYVHGRLYERYLHITLNQVVIESLLPKQNSKNIVIKSKVIATPYLLDTICDNLWDAAQNYNCIVLDANCKQHFEDYATSSQKFLLTELEGFKAKFLQCAKKLLFTDSISKPNGISITTSNDCGCRFYFGKEDIFDLGIIPAIKHTVSVLTGAITNEDIFGLYGIEHFFVAFNYFSSVFHRSYQDYFKYNLRRLIDINLEKKLLKIPYTVFSEPIGGLLQPVVNESCILADSFLYGNILQVFGETYSLSFKYVGVNCEVFVDGGYRMLEEEEVITIVEKGEIIPRTGAIKKVFYVIRGVNSHGEYEFPEFVIVITKRGSTINNNIINNALEKSEGLLEEYVVDEWVISTEKKFFLSDNPLYITVKYLNYSSFVTLSMQMGTDEFTYEKTFYDKDPYSVKMERLTIMNTQSTK